MLALYLLHHAPRIDKHWRLFEYRLLVRNIMVQGHNTELFKRIPNVFRFISQVVHAYIPPLKLFQLIIFQLSIWIKLLECARIEHYHLGCSLILPFNQSLNIHSALSIIIIHYCQPRSFKCFIHA